MENQEKKKSRDEQDELLDYETYWRLEMPAEDKGMMGLIYDALGDEEE